jgi:membrane protein implicated in regulation of membrane protease activity
MAYDRAMDDGDAGRTDSAGDGPDEPDDDAATTAELRRRVEERYDFDDFGPGDMAEMEPEEWEAAFDADTWITGEALLDRVEADLKARVLDRDVFARVERFGDVVVAYDERSYAAVFPDGSVTGRGTVLRDVEPTVALCSMESYDPPEVPDGPILPEPRDIPESNDTLGNTLLQVLGVVQLLAGAVLLGGYLLHLVGVLRIPGASAGGVNLVLLLVAGLGFVLVGLFLLVVVANARLSDRFRSEAYRDRLRSIGLAEGERPEFLEEIEGVSLPPRREESGADERR